MIIHVDMDAFYASIEQRDDPLLVGQPVLVGGVTGRSVVCAASYEARVYGCRSAMSMKEALRRCPDAVVRRPRFAVYRQVAREIREIFLSVTPMVEPLSLDEAFLDVSGSQACLGPAPEIGRRLKTQIREATGLVASVGVAPVKFVAKLASDHGKPDGFVVIQPNEVMNFLAPLPVSRLWGVGQVTGRQLESLGIRRVEDLRRWTPERLERELGSTGGQLWQLAHGIDARAVVADREPKSISHEETFDEDLTDAEELIAELHALTDEVCHRLRDESYLATTATLKIRFADFSTITRQVGWADPDDRTAEVWSRVRALWLAEQATRRGAIRLLGVGLSGLCRRGDRQPSLFEDPAAEADRRVDQAVDEVRRRFGIDSLRSADALRRRGRS
jgi:DNA polymerase-4